MAHFYLYWEEIENFSGVDLLSLLTKTEQFLLARWIQSYLTAHSICISIALNNSICYWQSTWNTLYHHQHGKPDFFRQLHGWWKFHLQYCFWNFTVCSDNWCRDSCWFFSFVALFPDHLWSRRYLQLSCVLCLQLLRCKQWEGSWIFHLLFTSSVLEVSWSQS